MLMATHLSSLNGSRDAPSGNTRLGLFGYTLTLLHSNEQVTPLMGDSELMYTVPLSLQADSKEVEVIFG